MKPLTLFLFLSLSLAGFGQIKIDSTVTYPIYWPDTVSLPCQPIYDTIPVVMLVSDTTPVNQEYWKSLGNGLIQKETVSVVSSEIWQMAGYEVMVKKEYEYGGVFFDSDRGLWIRWHWVHSCYLDHAKKPLNLCVWETKERKEK